MWSETPPGLTRRPHWEPATSSEFSLVYLVPSSALELARETSWADSHCGLSLERLAGLGLGLAGGQLGLEQGWATARVGRA